MLRRMYQRARVVVFKPTGPEGHWRFGLFSNKNVDAKPTIPPSPSESALKATALLSWISSISNSFLKLVLKVLKSAKFIGFLFSLSSNCYASKKFHWTSYSNKNIYLMPTLLMKGIGSCWSRRWGRRRTKSIMRMTVSRSRWIMWQRR